MFKFLSDLTKVLVEHNRIRSREVEARLHDDKRRVYLRVLNAWWKLMDRVAAGSEQLPKKDRDEFKAAKQEMMMFAAGSVIELWNEMEQAAGQLAAGESVGRGRASQIRPHHESDETGFGLRRLRTGRGAVVRVADSGRRQGQPTQSIAAQ